MNDQTQTLDVAWKTILKIGFAGYVFYLLYLVKDVVIWFFFALIISVLLEPAINFLRWLRIPKILAVIFTYLSIAIYMDAIEVDRPWLNAIVPAVGFLLSTLTLPFFRELWEKFLHNQKSFQQ